MELTQEKVGLIVTITTIIISTYLNLKEQLKAKKEAGKVTEIITSMDEKQNSKIDEISNELKRHGETINEMANYMQDHPFGSKVKQAIHCQVNIVLKTHRVKNKEFVSYLDSGIEVMNYLIDYLINSSFFDLSTEFDEEIFTRKAIMKLKAIKTSMDLSKLNIKEKEGSYENSHLFTEELKDVLYASLTSITAELQILKSGVFNGNSKPKFKELFIKESKNIITECIRTYDKYKDTKVVYDDNLISL